MIVQNYNIVFETSLKSQILNEINVLDIAIFDTLELMHPLNEESGNYILQATFEHEHEHQAFVQSKEQSIIHHFVSKFPNRVFVFSSILRKI